MHKMADGLEEMAEQTAHAVQVTLPLTLNPEP